MRCEGALLPADETYRDHQRHARATISDRTPPVTLRTRRTQPGRTSNKSRNVQVQRQRTEAANR